jgi:hypothetical protein
MKYYLFLIVLCLLGFVNPAFAQPPPASQTFAITSSTGPAVPPQAAAAGFTTLAMNWDWTGASQSGYQGGQQVNLATAPLSSYMEYCGAGPATMPGQLTPFVINNVGGPQCSDFTVINDNGTTALQIAEDNKCCAYGLDSSNYGSDNGVVFPPEFYVEWRARFLNVSNSPCCTGFWSVTQCCESYAYNEIVFFEFYTDDPNASMYGGWTFLANNNPEEHCMYENQPGYCPDPYHLPDAHQPLWNPTTEYHTIGERITQDPSGNEATCWYFDETQLNIFTGPPNWNNGTNCQTSPLPSGYTYTFPVGAVVWNGGEYSGSPTTVAIIQYYRIWTCSNWYAANPGSTGNGAADP